MAWTTPATWVAGQVVSASDLNTWIRDNSNFLNQTLRSVNGQARNWSDGFFMQVWPATFPASASGAPLSYPIPYTSVVPALICSSVATSGGAGDVVTAANATLTGFTAYAFNGGTVLTSGTVQINVLAIGA